MNDKELQKIIDTKNSTISVLKDTVKKWVREYNMLDACIELQNEKINAYKMSENEANVIIAELEAYKDVNEDFKTAWEELRAKNEKLKEEITELEEKFLTLNGKSYSYYTTLQEIKKIAEYIMTSDTEKWTLDEPFKQIEKILELTKVEEE